MEMIQENANLFEYGYFGDPLQEMFDSYDTNPNLVALDEVSYKERAEREILKIEVLDVDKYIEVNELREITNPTFFGAGGSVFVKAQGQTKGTLRSHQWCTEGAR